MTIDEYGKQLFPELYGKGLKIHDQKIPVYKYVSVESAIKILESSSVLFRTPNTFNDPFEFHPDILDYSATVFEMRQTLMKELYKRQKKIDFSNILHIISNTHLTEYINANKAVTDEERNTSLLFCTSLSNTKTLMWSHYADHHKGVCIGIRMPSVYDNLMTMKVNYTKEIIPQRFLTTDETAKEIAITYWMYTKSLDWAYEEEVRTIIASPKTMDTQGQGFKIVSIPKEFFCEIYYGLKTSQDDIKKIDTILLERNYNIEKKGLMKIKKGMFELEVDIIR